jgi:hypothetical protein
MLDPRLRGDDKKITISTDYESIQFVFHLAFNLAERSDNNSILV